MRRILAVILSLALMLSICAGGGIMLQADDVDTASMQLAFEWTAPQKDSVAAGWTWTGSFLDETQNREFLSAMGLPNAYLEIEGNSTCTEYDATVQFFINGGSACQISGSYRGEFKCGVAVSQALQDAQKELPVTEVVFQFMIWEHEKNHLEDGEEVADKNFYLNGLRIYIPKDTVAFEWTSSEKNTVEAGWTGTNFLNERRQDFLVALSLPDAYLEIEGNSTCSEYASSVQFFLNENYDAGAYQISGEYRGEFKCGTPISAALAAKGEQLPITEITFQFMIWEHEKKHLENGAEVPDGKFYINALRVYAPSSSKPEPSPSTEVELNVYWYPAQHDNTSTWDNTYYEGFTGDEYYDVFGKEAEIVKDVSTKWDIANDNWQYIWLGIEDKQHDPRHSFTVEISDIVFRTADSEYTYSGAKGKYSAEAWGSVMIPVKVADVCGEQNTTDFLRGLETVTVNLICTEHNGNKAVFDPTFASKSLVLSDQIGVNFFMNLGGLTEAERQSSYMTFTVSGNERRVNYDGSFRDETSGTYYGFTCPINSIQMADTITAVFHYGDGKTVSETYSVKDYVDYISGQSGFSEETVALVNALADLGHYVQPVLAETNGWNLGSDHAIMESKTEYNSETVSEVKTKAAEYKYEIVRPTGAIITNLTYSLDLETKTSIKIYVEVAEGSEVSATVNGQPAANCSLLSDGRYCIVIGDISAHKLGDKYNVTITAGNETATITNLSALSYVNTVLSSDNVSNEESYAVASIYNYYVAAEKYISAKGE